MKILLPFLLSAAALAPAPLSARPEGGAGGGALLVVSKQSHALAIVDGDSLKVLARVPIGEDPHEVTVAPDGRTAIVSNYGEMTLRRMARVDLVGRRALPPIDISPLRGAHGLAWQGGRLWITAGGSKAIASLDWKSGRLQAVVGIGEDNVHLVWAAPDGSRLVTSNPGSGTVAILDRVTVTPSVVPGSPPPPAAYTHAAWKQRLVAVGAGTEGFDVTPDGGEAWFGNADGSIALVDLAAGKVVGTVRAETVGANRLRFTPDGRLLLVTMKRGRDLVVIDRAGRRVVKRIPIEQNGASGIQVRPDGKRAFIACPRDHYVAVVDLERLEPAGRIDAGREPDGLAWWSR